MSNYYTEKGDKIYNSKAYAKTGAPMYKTKYGESTNINQETDIYKLECKDGIKYIGKTTDINRRMNQHFSGNGSQVTKKFKPKNYKIIDTCPGYFSNKIEQKHTDKNIKKYGYDNVRGGKYVNSKTLQSTSVKDVKCYRCGKKGHYANQCYGNDYSDDDCYD